MRISGTWLGVTLALESSDSRTLEWTSKFLGHHVDWHELDGSPDVEVRSTSADQSQFDCSGPCRPTELFLGRSGRQCQCSEVRHVWGAEGEARYAIREGVVTCYYPRTSVLSEREPARILREMAIDLALASGGGLRLHAAAAVVDGNAVLLVGPAGAGKSSALAQVLRAGMSYLANDRVLVLPGRSWIAAGTPIAVRWSSRQLNLFKRGRHWRKSYPESSVLQMRDEKAGFTKYELHPEEISAICEVPLITVAPIAAVVVCEPAAVGQSTCRQLPDGGAADAIVESTLLEDPAFPRWFGQPAQSVEAIPGDLAHLPAYLLQSNSVDTSGVTHLLRLLRAA